MTPSHGDAIDDGKIRFDFVLDVGERFSNPLAVVARFRVQNPIVLRLENKALITEVIIIRANCFNLRFRITAG